MKHIKNVRSFTLAILTTILAVACFGIILFHSFETRFLIAGIFLTVWSVINYRSAFIKKGTEEQSMEVADERDRYIVMKSSRMALRITNNLIFAACMINLFLYAVLKNECFIIVSITLCVCLSNENVSKRAPKK